MNPRQEQTLKELLVLIPVLVERKFRRGDSEHKADIQDMTVSELLNNAVEEKIDDLIYTLIALGKINRLKEKYETTDSGETTDGSGGVGDGSGLAGVADTR